MTGNPNAVAKGGVTKFINLRAPSGAASAVSRAANLAKRMGVWRKAFFRAGRGTGFRADVLIVEPAGASPVPPNVKKSFDFKFSCKDNEKIGKGQKAKYQTATGTTPKCIHIDGRLM